MRDNRKKSFRPLSGKWGYRLDEKMTKVAEKANEVSVPSRGNGVIDSIDNAIST